MGYDSALTIISKAAVELGLGSTSVAYASKNPDILQLCGLLESAGRDLVYERDWTHLQRETSFVTRPNWVKSTVYKAAGDVSQWQYNTAYAAGAYVWNTGGDAVDRLYIATTGGTSSTAGGPGPITSNPSTADGTVVWKFLNTGKASIVVHGLYWYTCAIGGTSGTVGPTSTGTSTDGGPDGTVLWTWTGNAADYSMPSDFSDMIDQTQWNRTNRLPMGGPLSPQEWQYLAGRPTGVVFTVLFRPVAGVLRLYPNTDPPGGYTIAYEYLTTSWVSAAGGTTPTTDRPTADTNLIYFDSLLMLRRLKRDWLVGKGFDSTAAQAAYEQTLERVAGSDGSAPVLDMRGRTGYDVLIGPQSIPTTGYGG